MQQAAIALLQANIDKDCDFSSCLKHLLGRPNVQKYMSGGDFTICKLPIDQAHYDHHAGWYNFSMSVFGKLPNICSNHVTCNFCYYSVLLCV